MFTRKELQEIRSKAYAKANEDGLNPYWKRALEDLSNDADRLDAMIARIEEAHVVISG